MSDVGEVVVTGSASGLGAALVDRLAADGFRPIGVDRHRAEVVADLGSPEGRARACEAVRAMAPGGIRGLVSAAAASPIDPDPANVVSVNHFGALAVLDGLVDLLQGVDGAAAVAVSSIGAAAGPFDERLGAAILAGDEDVARAVAADGTEYRSAFAYNAAKVGVALGVRERAARWARLGVRLNAVAPGRMETPMLAGLLEDPVIAAGLDDMPVGVATSATASEVAGVVAFLLGPEAGFIHGQVLFVDGGVEAQLRSDRF